MKSDSFKDQYRHPKWQKKRLEILSDRAYECEFCQDSETELQVHHIEYTQGKKVWEYGEDNFLCLCKPCHERLSDALLDTRRKASWEVYLCTLESLNEAWRCDFRESLGLILHLLAVNPTMIRPVLSMLTTLRDNASKITQARTQGQ